MPVQLRNQKDRDAYEKAWQVGVAAARLRQPAAAAAAAAAAAVQLLPRAAAHLEADVRTSAPLRPLFLCPQEAHARGDDYQKRWGRAKVQRDGRDWGM